MTGNRKAIVLRCEGIQDLQKGTGTPLLVADSIRQAGQWLTNETNLRACLGIHPGQPLPAFQSERFPDGPDNWKWHLMYKTPGNVMKFLIVRHVAALTNHSSDSGKETQ